MAEPKVRFKRDDGSCYPAWIVKTFSESFDALNNNSFSRDMLNYDGGDAKNIHYGDILVKFGDICNIQDDNVPYVNDGVAIQKYAPLKDGDVILADTAEDETVGKAIEIYNTKNDVVISGLHTMACRPVDVFAPKYLGYYMNSPAFHDQLRPYMQGVKVTSISRPNIADAKLYFPKSSEEQQKIAEFLSYVDEVIVASEEEIKNLETQKKAVMKKIFSQEVRFKREDGIDFPEWTDTLLGDHLIPYTEITTMNNQYPPLTSSRQGLFLQEDYFKKQVASEDNTGYNIVPYGYFTYRHMSDDTIFRFNINYLVENGIVSTLYPVFTTDGFFVDRFLQYYLNESPDFAKYCVLQKQGGSRTYMYFSKLIKYTGSMPSDIEEQRLIADFLSDFDEAIAAAKKELELWKELKKGLLQQMFV